MLAKLAIMSRRPIASETLKRTESLCLMRSMSSSRTLRQKHECRSTLCAEWQTRRFVNVRICDHGSSTTCLPQEADFLVRFCDPLVLLFLQSDSRVSRGISSGKAEPTRSRHVNRSCLPFCTTFVKRAGRALPSRSSFLIVKRNPAPCSNLTCKPSSSNRSLISSASLTVSSTFSL